MGNFFSTRLFWLPEANRLIIVSMFQSRDFPIRDLDDIQSESSPDLQKLYPLFTFFTSNQDYTRTFTRYSDSRFLEKIFILHQRT